MRPCTALLATALVVLSACSQPSAPDKDQPVEPQARADDLKRAIDAPLARARDAQQSIDAGAQRTQAAVDAAEAAAN